MGILERVLSYIVRPNKKELEKMYLEQAQVVSDFLNSHALCLHDVTYVATDISQGRGHSGGKSSFVAQGENIMRRFAGQEPDIKKKLGVFLDVMQRNSEAPKYTTYIYTSVKRSSGDTHVIRLPSPLLESHLLKAQYDAAGGIGPTARALGLKKLFEVSCDTESGENMAVPIGVNPDAFDVFSKSRPLKYYGNGNVRLELVSTLFNRFTPSQLSVWGTVSDTLETLEKENAVDKRSMYQGCKIRGY